MKNLKKFEDVEEFDTALSRTAPYLPQPLTVDNCEWIGFGTLYYPGCMNKPVHINDKDEDLIYCP